MQGTGDMEYRVLQGNVEEIKNVGGWIRGTGVGYEGV